MLKVPDWVPGIGGMGINIPLIPEFAKGTLNTPDTFIAGEEGPELITNAPGRRVYTAAQTSSILAAQSSAGTPSNDWIGDTINALSADDNSETYNDNSQPVTITYSPQYTFGGTPDKEEMVEAEKMSQEEFRRMMDQWMKDNRRTKLC